MDMKKALFYIAFASVAVINSGRAADEKLQGKASDRLSAKPAPMPYSEGMQRRLRHALHVELLRKVNGSENEQKIAKVRSTSNRTRGS